MHCYAPSGFLISYRSVHSGAVLAFGCLLGLCAEWVATSWGGFGDVYRKGA